MEKSPVSRPSQSADPGLSSMLPITIPKALTQSKAPRIESLDALRGFAFFFSSGRPLLYALSILGKHGVQQWVRRALGSGSIFCDQRFRPLSHDRRQELAQADLAPFFCSVAGLDWLPYTILASLSTACCYRRPDSARWIILSAP